VSAAGAGLTRGAVTARYRIDLGPLELLERLGPGEEVDGAARGSIEVELGLFDDLIRRQTFTVSEPVEGDGSGLDTVATTYVIEYWDFDTALEVREPN